MDKLSTQTETAQAWERRKKRINYENLFIIMYDRDGLTEDDYNKLKRFKCKNKRYLTGFVFPHITFSFRKSKMEECFCKLQNSFELTFTHKFRSKEDLNLQIFDMWETMHNTFEPIENFGVLINSSQFSYDMINSKLNDASLQCVCINDGGGIDDESFESVKTMVNQLLQEKYSHKSSFELW